MRINSSHPFYERFKKILSDPLNQKIPRVENAGQIIDGNLIMHNGIKVVPKGYCGDFSDILEINKGVHEPSEEFVFQEMFSCLESKKPIMYELGSYWCFYTMWFLQKFPLGVANCIEQGGHELAVGVENMAKNNMSAKFTNQWVGKGGWNLDTNAEHGYIDILHSDIQGYEYEMLIGANGFFDSFNIGFAFISTHSNYLHQECLNFLRSKNYRIVSEVDLTNTFCEDGIIVAQNPNMKKMIHIEIPKIQNHHIVTDSYIQSL